MGEHVYGGGERVELLFFGLASYSSPDDGL